MASLKNLVVNSSASTAFFSPKAVVPSVNSRRKCILKSASDRIQVESDGSVGQSRTSGAVSTAVVDPPTWPTEPLDAVGVDSTSYAMQVMTMSVEAEESDDESDMDERTAMRAAAAAEVRAELATHTPATFLEDKLHWLVAVMPPKPVAGEEVVIYFNRAQSEVLRHRPRLHMQLGFNKWERPANQSRLDLLPAEGLPRNETTDFVFCRTRVPEDTFELNFVVSDGEGAYDNNSGQDYTFPVSFGVTWDEWIDLAIEYAAVAEEARKRVEREKAAEEEAKRIMAAERKDVELGNMRAADIRHNTGGLRGDAAIQWVRDGRTLWLVEPALPTADGKFRLRYNRLAGPLNWLNVPPENALMLKYGFNSWTKPQDVLLTRMPASANKPDEEWWGTEISTPFEAVVVNFVINYFEHYDNNDMKDYRVPVSIPTGLTEEEWQAKLAEKFIQEERSTRVAAEAESRAKEESRMATRNAVREHVMAVERRKVRHVLFTTPEVLTAGSEVTVHYNPSNTNLAGRPDVYIIGGWNRWAHRKTIGPLKMSPPAEGESHFKATMTIPRDAHLMDFVFADVPGGNGTYDNRFGTDYHLRVAGGIGTERTLHVVHVAVEMAPIAKVGGLGDVVTALGRAVKEAGHQVEVIVPRFDFFMHSPVLAGQMRYETEFEWGGTRVYVSTAIVEGLRVFFIEPRNGMFSGQSVYGRSDDGVRFDFFCKAALEFLLKTGRQPDILHCHDWSTAHVAKTYWDDYHPYGLYRPKIVFTIHNLEFGAKKIAEAAAYCQRFTTVSPTYAFETGGNAALAPHNFKFSGIRNGIDPDLWDPSTCQWLPKHYTHENCGEGKAAARAALRSRLGMTGWGDKPIVALVSRLTAQKGVHLIKHAVWRTLDRGAQFVLLGSAPDPRVQADFNALAQQYQGDYCKFVFKYDEPLSHLIYAAADIVLVPSMFEPCGLTQMIAMRYGAIPVVRHTGGLRDTVFDVDFDKGRAAWELAGSTDWNRDGIDATNGFAFEGTDPGALDSALNRALDAWYNANDWFRGLQARVMQQDWTWARPALDYIEVYFQAIK